MMIGYSLIWTNLVWPGQWLERPAPATNLQIVALDWLRPAKQIDECYAVLTDAAKLPCIL